MHLIVIQKHRGLLVPPQRHLFRFRDALSEVDAERMQDILTRVPARLSPLAAERVLRDLQGVAPFCCLFCDREDCAEERVRDLVTLH